MSENSPWKEHRKAHAQALGPQVAAQCTKKGFHAVYVDSPEEALEKVLSLIPADASVGISGSVSVREIGAVEALQKRGNTVVQHWDPSLKTPEERKARLLEEFSCSVHLTGTNAMTKDGMLVNIDGTGNRVAAMSWGPGKIIFIVGINKICPDLETAIQRVRDVATPPNAIRLKLDTPCTKTGYCVNCDSPQRVCRALLVLERATLGRESHVIIVGEPLGY
ncbi:MAG TPA: lactate utilization protein [Synergistaceae bacterium]|nr:lactate utilization protein [Synergistaceae bacterium]HPJ24548.1 lactate utilization protein [Synergistaceae bacterium]HPQ36305.1 lactate utilization protein [Synergistaceae bacterium]